MASLLNTSKRSTSRSVSPSLELSKEQGNASSNEGNSAVDLEAIEQQKENIQPLTSGRSAKTLHSLFTSDRKVLQDELEKGHERFKREIEQAEEEGSDDPLDVYHRYVRWTLSSYPSGPSHASHLVPLLERSTRRFVHEEQYKSDIRLLKLWLLYAKYVDCPKDIFRFLEGLQCGTSLAGFYEEWALLEEQSNNLPAADSIYNLGIARRAQPLERLKKRRDAFQARMLLPRAPTSDEPSTSSSTSRSSTTQRSILGGSSTGPAFRGTAATQSSTKAALPNNGAAGFAVFKDDGTTAANATLASQETWSDFGTNASRKRENERAAVPWKGETLPVLKDGDDTASRPISLSSSIKFEVFRDEDAEIPATDLGVSQNRGEAVGLSVAKSLRAPPEAELLRADPFRHYQKDSVTLAEIPNLPFATKDASTSSSALKPSKASSSSNPTRISSSSKTKSSVSQNISSSSAIASGEKRKERVASPLHEIYPEGASGPEFSFEELLAAKRHLRKLKTGQPGSRSAPSDEPWQVEARERGTSWRVDGDGKVVLRDPHSGEALFGYLRKQDEEEQEAKLAKRRLQRQQEEAQARREAEAAAEAERILREEAQEHERRQREAESRAEAERLEAEERERAREAKRAREQKEEEHRLKLEEEAEARRQYEREEEQRRKQETLRAEAQSRQMEEEERLNAEAEAEARRLAEDQQDDERDLFDDERSASPPLSTDYRPPSPTINTKAALAEVNAMFGKTMRFDGTEGQNDDYDSSATEQSGSSENDFEGENEQDAPFRPSQAETDASFWSVAQSQSQQPFSSQPFGTQQSIPFDSQSSSLGFPSASESGETTEESDNESDVAIPRGNQLHPAQHLHQSLSRSSSSSSSSASMDQPVSLQASLRSHVPAFTPFKESSENDENALASHRKERSAFKPARTPLGIKPLASSTASSSKPAFAVFCEEEEEQAPSSAQRPDDFAEESDYAAGYGMGRRLAGNNRFANMMDIMTPITERTCEFGMQTATMTSIHNSEVQARMLTDGQSDVEDLFDQGIPEDLASSRGSNWDAGRRLEQIDEEADYSSQIDGIQGGFNARRQAGLPLSISADMTTTSEPSNTSTVLASTTLYAEAHGDQDGPCDPLAPEVVEDILNNDDMPLISIHGFKDYRHQLCSKLDGLQRVARSRRKSASANSSRNSSVHEETAWQIELHQDVFSVREKLGEGGFGAVFRVAELLDTLATDDEDDIAQTALKVESPPNLWEFYILNALHARLPERTKMSIIKAQRLYAFQDESYLLLDYCDQGSLLDAVNHAHDAGIGPAGTVSTGLEEVLAIFFTIELTRILECLHTYRFLHGDFKIDNCLVRLEDVPGGAARNWSNGYKADGSGGWKHKGVSIIDFGRTVDLNNFKAGQTFTTDVKTDKHDCVEVKEGRPWVYQPDYFGLACIAHVLLFGKYLEPVQSGMDVKTGRARYAIKEPLKRYHQANLWNRFFDILLNPTSFTDGEPTMPITNLLKDSRHDMERWLEVNSDKNGKSLKGLLKKVEIWALSRH